MKIDGVTKSFGDVVAVDDVSLSIAKGEFMTLLGPSGCGKTTTLRMVAGFVKPDKGSIYLTGKKIDDVPPHQRNIGMVFQSYALFPHMTVYENLAFGLKMRKVGQAEIENRVKEILVMVRLSGFEKRYPRQLSGGQQQRIALARSLVIEPDVLLLDEPLSNLDFKLRQQMRLEIMDIQRRIGVTSIYVTHDQGEALVMSSRLAVMNKGKIAQVGTPSMVYEHPENVFVADFIGESNFFKGKISAIDGNEIEVVTDHGLTLYTDYRQCLLKTESFKQGSKVSICVRAERIGIDKEKVMGKNVFRGEVEEVAYIGSDVKYNIRLENDEVLIVHKQIADSSELFKIGDVVYVDCKPKCCSLIPNGAD